LKASSSLPDFERTQDLPCWEDERDEDGDREKEGRGLSGSVGETLGDGLSFAKACACSGKSPKEDDEARKCLCPKFGSQSRRGKRGKQLTEIASTPLRARIWQCVTETVAVRAKATLVQAIVSGEPRISTKTRLTSYQLDGKNVKKDYKEGWNDDSREANYEGSALKERAQEGPFGGKGWGAGDGESDGYDGCPICRSVSISQTTSGHKRKPH
jgi:phage baseplate assembly protein W